MGMKARTDGIEIEGTTLQYMKRQKYTIWRQGVYMKHYKGLLALAL